MAKKPKAEAAFLIPEPLKGRPVISEAPVDAGGPKFLSGPKHGQVNGVIRQSRGKTLAQTMARYWRCALQAFAASYRLSLQLIGDGRDGILFLGERQLQRTSQFGNCRCSDSVSVLHFTALLKFKPCIVSGWLLSRPSRG